MRILRSNNLTAAYPNVSVNNLTAAYPNVSVNNLTAAYPNASVALRIYLWNFATNVTDERTLSALKRIKNELRATMEQNRMGALSLLCIEYNIVESLQIADVIDNFARQNAYVTVT